jgi:hypothetical protein
MPSSLIPFRFLHENSVFFSLLPSYMPC